MNVEQSDLDVDSSKLRGTENGEPTFPMSPMQFFKEKLSSTIENDLSSIAKHLYFTLILNDQECSLIEQLTKSQRENKRWFEYREGQLTALSFHSIYTLRKQTNPENLVHRILSAKDISHIPAVQWESITKIQQGRNTFKKCLVMSLLHTQQWD